MALGDGDYRPYSDRLGMVGLLPTLAIMEFSVALVELTPISRCESSSNRCQLDRFRFHGNSISPVEHADLDFLPQHVDFPYLNSSGITSPSKILVLTIFKFHISTLLGGPTQPTLSRILRSKVSGYLRSFGYFVWISLAVEQDDSDALDIPVDCGYRYGRRWPNKVVKLATKLGKERFLHEALQTC